MKIQDTGKEGRRGEGIGGRVIEIKVDEGKGKRGKGGWDGFGDCRVVEGHVVNSLIQVAEDEAAKAA